MTLCDSTMPLKNSVAVACTALLLAALALPAAGSGWTTADNPEHLCGKLSLCTASNFTWPVTAVFDKDLGCALLARKGLENLLIAGKSPAVKVSLTLELSVCLGKSLRLFHRV